MVTKWILAAILVCGLTHGLGFAQMQLPVGSQVEALSSKDYLKLMEQANLAAGIQPGGGNFPGAKPRPRGSLEIPPQNPTPIVAPLPPAIEQRAIPQLPPPQASVAVPAIAPQPGIPQAGIPQAGIPQAGIPQAGIPQGFQQPNVAIPPGVSAQPQSPGVWFPPASTMPNQLQPAEPAMAQPNLATPIAPSTGLQSNSNKNAQKLSTQPWTGPRWVGRYQTVGLRRPGDESLSFSQTGELGTFGSDLASEITLGYLTNPIDCYEFTYLGSLHWNRALESSGPANSQLSSSDLQWMAPFQNADSIQQTHSAGLRQYGLNRRWLTDDIGNSTLGLRVIDYREEYRLRSLKGGRQALYGLDSDNLLVGLASGMELWRPVSQRVALGGSIDGGLYANFAEAGIVADDAHGRVSAVDDQDLSLAASLGLHLRARYQLRSWAGLYGGYRWMVLSGLATVDDQAPPPLSDSMVLRTSSDATILFHGFDAGLELKF